MGKPPVSREVEGATIRDVLVAVLALCFTLVAGKSHGAFTGLLVDTDSYTRISRIVASLEAGSVLAHIPRDNSGHAVALHWSHLLDAAILLLALPLWPFVGVSEALRLAGSALGPISAVAAALAALWAARVLGASVQAAFAAGILAALSPAITGYGAFGRADHHVLLGAVAIVCPLLVGMDRRFRLGSAALWGGVTAGLGLWLSPEVLPFVLLAWAFAMLRDIDGGRIANRTRDFCVALLVIVVLAFLIDPPPSGRWAVEIDRLSRPFVELAALMMAVALLGRYLPRLAPGSWPAAITAGALAGLAVGAWALIYPAILRGAEGVFSAEAWLRIWRTNNEMRSPLDTAHDTVVFLAVPLLVVAATTVLLLWRRPRPADVLAVIGLAFVAYMACRHVRLSVYLQLAAAVAAALLLDRLAARLPALHQRAAIIVAIFALAVAPYAAGIAFPAPKETGAGQCDARAAAADLTAFAGRVVLSSINDAPALLYFSRIITVAGPYHRAEQRILDVMDAYAERDFSAGMPDSFRKTEAVAVLVCASQSYELGTLANVLARGEPPSWLTEVPISTSSGFRLYAVR
jgi:hypothetical protein